MDIPCHIPSDDEVGITEHNAKRRAVFYIACPLCKEDYEVRDGNWLSTFTKAGTEMRIKVCVGCYRREVDAI